MAGLHYVCRDLPLKLAASDHDPVHSLFSQMRQLLYELYQILLNRRTPISTRDLVQQLEVSERTIKRYVRDLRLYFDAPIDYVHGQGYVIHKSSDLVELSGQWFSTSSLEILLMLHLTLSRMSPESLQLLTNPLIERLETHLNNSKTTRTFPTEKIRILASHRRELRQGVLSQIVQALTDKKRTFIKYRSRNSNVNSCRVLSVQRLVYYRDRWYIDAWDHKRNALRTFALDRVALIRQTQQDAIEMNESELDRTLRAGYGLFAGAHTRTAKLRFNKEAANWVSEEIWHSQQTSFFEAEGCWVLTVPYSNPTELVSEILRHGSTVEVLEPEELRNLVSKELHAAAAQYPN